MHPTDGMLLGRTFPRVPFFWDRVQGGFRKEVPESRGSGLVAPVWAPVKSGSRLLGFRCSGFRALGVFGVRV